MATQKKAAAKKPAAKKAPARKTTARKAAPKKSEDFTIRDSAEKVVNIYLGVIAKGIDTVQDNIESARKENEKRMKDLEKRGAKFRKELSKRVEGFEVSELVDDTTPRIVSRRSRTKPRPSSRRFRTRWKKP
jgi:hypothetical protein